MKLGHMIAVDENERLRRENEKLRAQVEELRALLDEDDLVEIDLRDEVDDLDDLGEPA